ncbi:hypothetical protein A359_05750 [secondary endosymbiont of Ctenarytaina eucalypti]|uniref:Uncharacterized protein n=1 Tax=secondary endosymbiont of Ctenarytaina eucalypti TaxID=1199245 RepID=J3TFG9_9ENTR|nr:hypothetical protein A359_05750 [secondary endosymbiont of Ctenarytaina eucalypti]
MNEDKDYVDGIFLAKNLLPFMLSYKDLFSISRILMPVLVVPESKRVDLMLKEFRSTCYLIMTIIIDECGGVFGLITIAGIL